MTTGTGKNKIITSYFSGVIDPQRNTAWKPEKESITIQADYVLNNCFEEDDKFIRVETKTGNPYFDRWFAQKEFIKDKDFEFVFFTDATDVVMNKLPFGEMKKGIIYIGDEPETLGNQWLLNHTKINEMKSYFLGNRNKTLLNCGVIGGDKETMLNFLEMACEFIEKNQSDPFDMSHINYLLYKNELPIEFGRHITSVFRKFEENSTAWFTHK